MKITLKKHPEGSIICQINEDLSDNEQELLVRGIAKFLANGKARIVVEVGAKISKAGLEKIQKGLLPQVDLAKRLGGEIRYVMPADAKEGAGAQGGAPGLDSDLLKAEAEIARLKEENKLLLDKIEELMTKVSVPSSDAELRASLEHYRKLAEGLEAQSSPDVK